MGAYTQVTGNYQLTQDVSLAQYVLDVFSCTLYISYNQLQKTNYACLFGVADFTKHNGHIHFVA